jgi:ribosomal protein S18 acetylase RimI-like enzyme
MEITIRKVTAADVSTLSVIAKQSFYDTFTGTCSEEDMQGFLQDYFNEEQLANEINTPNDHCVFAELDGKPVGYMRFMEDYSGLPLMQQWKAMELKRIYVLKEYHSKGIAQQLMNYIIEFSVKEKYEVIWLGVWEHNLRAQRFYEKYGFVNSGHTHDFPIGNTPQTDFWFWKFLK